MKLKRISGLLTIGLLAAALLSLLTVSPASAKETLVWAVGSKVPTMDLYATTSLNLTNIYNMVSDPILTRDLKTLELKPHLAESWKRIDDKTWEFPSEDRGPYADFRNSERGIAIREAIEELPWEYRELIVMRHFAELSYGEIAEIKEMPLGTVKNKLFRGRQMLKQTLQDFLTD